MTWIDVGEGSTASKDLDMGEGDTLEFDWDGNEQPTAPSVRMNARSAIVSGEFSNGMKLSLLRGLVKGIHGERVKRGWIAIVSRNPTKAHGRFGRLGMMRVLFRTTNVIDNSESVPDFVHQRIICTPIVIIGWCIGRTSAESHIADRHSKHTTGGRLDFGFDEYYVTRRSGDTSAKTGC